jgi:UDP-N-acetyl-D-glucosamine dehydrogenase
MTPLERIRSKSAHVVVTGVGYVGLPLATAFAKAGFRVTGLDTDSDKVSTLNRGESYVRDVPSAEVARHVSTGHLRATTDARVLADADAVLICVPTPLNKTKDPDMRFILDATEEFARYQRSETLVVLESTTYPGATTEVLIPRLTSGGFALGRDVFVAFSPERVDPGNEVYGTQNTPKVIGGATPRCLEHAVALYEHIVDRVVPVSSTETAEMVKLLENTFRAVNIGLVNEVAIMARKLGIDPFEVIRAAATKPFGFMPFYPGPGLGGHCIPVDPLCLSWKLRSLKYHARFIDLADAVNSAMPGYVLDRVTSVLNGEGKAVRGSRILVYGVAYKPNVADVRESPALDIIHGLEQMGALVSYMDPEVPRINEGGRERASIDVHSSFAVYDLVVIVTDHRALDRARLVAEARMVLDTRDALCGVAGDRSCVHGL